MSPSNTRERSSRRNQSETRTNDQPTTKSIFPPGLRLRMPSVFNIIRASVYAAVLVWTIICLAIAVHLKGILVSSDLTRFIPFAIFVCCASLLLVLALLGFGLWRDRNPISTRIELGCLGLAGALWLALGAFLASSESEAADVECFSSSSEPVDMPGFDTETYHAQYRVIEAFSFFNVILIWAFIIFLLYLAVRHHRWGHTEVWLSSVTAYPWFAGASAQTGKLPAPVTAQRSKSQTQRALVPAPPPDSEKPVVSRRPTGGSGRRAYEGTRERDRVREREVTRERDGERDGDRYRSPTRQPTRQHSTSRRRSPTRNEEATDVFWMPHRSPDQAHVTDHRRPRDKYLRGASPRR